MRNLLPLALISALLVMFGCGSSSLSAVQPDVIFTEYSASVFPGERYDVEIGFYLSDEGECQTRVMTLRKSYGLQASSTFTRPEARDNGCTGEWDAITALRATADERRRFDRNFYRMERLLWEMHDRIVPLDFVGSLVNKRFVRRAQSR